MAPITSTESADAGVQLAFPISMFATLKDTTPKCEVLIWPKLSTWLQHHIEVPRKEDAELWSPATFRAGGRRTDAEVESLCALTVDVDHGPPLDEAKRVLERLKYPAILYTTHNHTADQNRYRIVLPLAHEVPAGEWRAFYSFVAAWLEKLLGGTLDRSCSNESRAYYVPSHPPGGEHFATVFHEFAPMLDPRPMIAEERKIEEERHAAAKQRTPTIGPPAGTADHHYLDAAIGDELRELGGVQPGDQSNSLNRSACKLASLLAGADRLDLEADVQRRMLAIALAWPRSREPWSEYVAMRTIRSGWTAGVAQPRDLSQVGRTPRLRAVPAAPADEEDQCTGGKVLVSSFDPTEKTRNEKTDPRAQGSKFTLLGDLLLEPEEEIDWLLDGLLITGGVSLLAGRPKAGKSTLARYLMSCAAKGSEFLGRATKPGPVLCVALEEKKSEVVRHFRAMGAGLGDPVHVHVGAAPQDPIPWLEAAIASHRPTLVVVDPLQRFLRLKDGNDYTEVTAAIEPIMELARKWGTHILLLHHLRKGGGNDEQAILGSTALFGAVDTALILLNRGGTRTIRSDQRYGENLSDLAIQLDKGTGRFSVSGDVAEMHQETVMQGIVATLGSGELTEPEIRKQVGGNTGDSAKALRKAVVGGRVVRRGGGKKGDPHRYSLPGYVPPTDSRSSFSPKSPNKKPKVERPSSEEDV